MCRNVELYPSEFEGISETASSENVRQKSSAGDNMKYWVSCRQATGQVNTNEEGRLVFVPPIWGKFIGQPLTNLTQWLTVRFGSCDCEEL